VPDNHRALPAGDTLPYQFHLGRILFAKPKPVRIKPCELVSRRFTAWKPRWWSPVMNVSMVFLLTNCCIIVL